MGTDSVTSWVTSSIKLPTTLEGHRLVSYNGYLIETGGHTYTGGSHVYYPDVRKTQVQPNGDIIAWAATTALPAARAYHGSISYNGYIYVIGGYSGSGYTSTVYYAAIDASGNVGAWSAATNSLPYNWGLGTLAVCNGYLYAISGYWNNAYSSTVYYSQIGAGGQPDAWISTTSLPGVRAWMMSDNLVYNNRIYVPGGWDGSARTSTVYYASCGSGGITSWSTTTNGLPETRYYHSAAIDTDTGQMYVFGGLIGSGGTLTGTTKFATINPSTGNIDSPWSNGPNLPATRERTAASYTSLFKTMHVTGGQDDLPTPNYYDTISYGKINDQPAVPTLFTPWDFQKGGEWANALKPQFDFSTTDPDGDTLQYNIVVDDDPAFGSPNIDATSTTPTGWSGTPPYVSGASVTYTAQADLTSNTTYWWKVRAIDPAGSNTWSSFSGSRSVTIQSGQAEQSWFQTTGDQFNKDTLYQTTARGSPYDDVVIDTPLGNGEGMIAYGKNNINLPRYRLWDGTGWGSELDALDIGNNSIAYVVLKPCPKRNEYALGTLSRDGHVNLQIYNGSTQQWGNLKEMTTQIGTINFKYRGFDLAYETRSGDLIAVVNNNVPDPIYYIWDGTSWSGPGTTIDIPTTGIPIWIQLESDPQSDEVLLMTLDLNLDVSTAVWSGSNWGSTLTLETNTGISSKENIAIAYEQLSGDAMVMWNDNTGSWSKLQYSVWSGSLWSSEYDLTIGSITEVDWISLSSDPSSDRILLGMFVDYNGETSYIKGSIWDGNTWSAPTTLDSDGGSSFPISPKRMDTLFERSGNEAMISWNIGIDGNADGSDYEPDYRRYTTSWQTTQESQNIDGYARVIQLVPNPSTDEAILVTGDNSEDLNVQRWTGSAWTGNVELETSLSSIISGSSAYEGFMFAYRSYFESQIIDTFSDNDYANNPTWTVSAGTWSAASGYLESSTSTTGRISTPILFSPSNSYCWELRYRHEDNDGTNSLFRFWPLVTTQDPRTQTAGTDGYLLYVNSASTSNSFTFYRQDGTNYVTLIANTITDDTNWHIAKVCRTASGAWSVHRDGSQLGSTVTDTTHSSAGYMGFTNSAFDDNHNTYHDDIYMNRTDPSNVISKTINYSDGPSTKNSWSSVIWNKDVTSGGITVAVQKFTTGWTWTGIQSSSSPIDISSLGTASQIRLVSNLTYSGGSPRLLDWEVLWNTINLPSVILTAPNGGETWPAGTAQTITWNPATQGTYPLKANPITLYYSTMGSLGPWTQIVTNDANDGTYTWIVPNSPTTNCYVRVVASDNQIPPNNGSDMSDGPCTIGSGIPPSITLTTPNGGESWVAGTTQSITWNPATQGTFPFKTNPITLYYSTTGSSGPWTQIATNEANDGTYSWLVPSALTANAFVKIEAADNQMPPNVGSDISNAAFSIVAATPPSVTLTSPNGGESWLIATTQTIAWNVATQGTFPLKANPITLYYSTTGPSGPWTQIATNEANDGTYSWTVPSTQTTNAYVKIEVADNQVPPNIGSDASNGAFTIYVNPPSVTVSKPNGGEKCFIQAAYDITYVVSPGSYPLGANPITISYSTTGSSGPWTQIATSLPNTGLYNWSIPTSVPPSANAYIRVTAKDNQATPNIGSDTGNSAFTFANGNSPTVTVTKPNGGEKWYVQSGYDITYSVTKGTFPLAANPITISYSTAGSSGPWTQIAANLPNTGTYNWSIPTSITPSTNCYIKIDAKDDRPTPNIGTDKSDSSFTIANGNAPIVTVTSPNGGEIWHVGEQRSILWTAVKGTFPLATNPITISYSTTGPSGPWSTIASNIANTGSYQWTVTLPTSTNSYVKVDAKDDRPIPNVGSDTSNAAFTITDAVPPAVQVKFPNGGESFTVGTIIDLKWNATNGTLPLAPKPITIWYSTNGTTGPWSLIASDLTNTGLHAWTVPSTLSSDCYIRVKANDTQNNSGSDIGDGPFNIIAGNAAPYLNMVSPIGGELWRGTKDIAWEGADANGNSVTYNISISTDSGNNWELRNSSTYLENSTIVKHSYALDTIKYADGTHYRIQIDANDHNGSTINRTTNDFIIDNSPPSSTVSKLPTYTRSTSFIVNWSGNDDTSGIDCLDIHYSVDQSAFIKWLTTSNLSATFNGNDGHRYAFYSIAHDLASNIEEPPQQNDSWTTIDITPPSLDLLNPSPGSKEVPTNVIIKLRAATDTDRSSFEMSLSSASGIVDGDVSWMNDIASFTPKSVLAVDTKYDLKVDASDLAGNPASAQCSFTTAKVIDTVPPKVLITSPLNGATVSSVSIVKIVFSEGMLAPDIESSASISHGNIAMATWYPSNFTLDLNVQNLSMNQIYTITIDSAKAKDLSGNELDGDGDGAAGGDFIFSFYVTTQQPAKLVITVVDRSNQPVIGANVSLYLNGSLIRKAQTSGNGMVEFNDLMPGSYRIKAEKEGYLAAVHDMTLKFGQTENTTLSLLKSSEVEAGFAWLFWLLPLIVIVAVLALILVILQRRNKKECPECEKRVPLKSNVCQYCGYDFIRKKAKESKAEIDEEETEKPAKPEMPKTTLEAISRLKHERIGPALPIVVSKIEEKERPVETEELRIKDRKDRTIERDETRSKPRTTVPMGAIEESEEDQDIKTGMNTLLLTSENRWCFEKFKSLMSSSAHGLCISTMQPNKIRIRYKIQRASLYWLTDTSSRENTLNPKRLEFEITKVILEFIKTKKNGIILIDGLEYLISENGFEKVNRFIKKVSDLASNHDHTLIMMINPSALASDPLSILKKNFDDIVEKW